ncbi:ankyrin repeat protein [Colletotrichum kahawae]|uniref:Ankyrin repeat protein n=1 Tax=Colletotrichum kahawae TaxID=34407 RepID=A0AAD9YRN6_COLKA|nr:ankyrin repeat protein [Colletotrichum kahawae]
MAQSTEFEGDEFSNNLFSDLAPLLTLFGEQVTKQFLSLSMGWADNVLLAMGPLGIITTVVSAIRVGGGRTMKAVVGRARENQSTAEQELLSSTSSNVCELWSGQQVIRLIGETEGAKTLLVAGDGEVFDLESAEDQDLIKLSPHHHTIQISTESLHNPTPNLALNAGKAIASPTELWFWAVIGVLLQLFATAFPGIVTYSWRWSKVGSPVAQYGYPCFLIGTILLTLGMTLCGHIIEGVTTEQEISLTTGGKRRNLKFFSLQGSRTVGDQKFPSCVLFLAEDDNVLKISRLNSKNYR